MELPCVLLLFLFLGSSHAWYWGPAPPPKPNYKVSVQVSWDGYAGTDADVYIKLYGQKRFYQQGLDSSANDFERGSSREYQFNCGGDIGALTTIEIGHTSGDWWDGPDWKVDKVSVYDPYRKVWITWYCRCWMYGYSDYKRYKVPVNGGWSNWRPWPSCPTQCNNARQKQTRYRYCNNPSPLNGGKYCSGSGSMTQWCPYKPCPVNGYWKPWSSYGSCDKTCGSGYRTRTRLCVQPKYGGKACQGASSMKQQCMYKMCPVNGYWKPWSSYGSCDKTCGSGYRTSTRQCVQPKYGGKVCQGASSMKQPCKVKECPVNGYWKPWNSWGACSVTCASGKKTRSRTCVRPRYGGAPCSGPSLQTTDCKMTSCPVDGGWNGWKKTGSCSKECGGGLQTFARSCNNPAPEYGGQQCQGPAKKTATCNSHYCPIDGKWGDWKEVTQCDVECGGGHFKKERSCTNPAPAYGGKACVGDSLVSVECNTQPCPIDGGWTDWTYMASCSKECGGGIRQMQRSCTQPAPSYGGAACEGPHQKDEECNTHHCPINGGWGDWQTSGVCTALCGGGMQPMVRVCDNPTAAHGGTDCEGEKEGSQPCNTQACDPVDGGWSDWTAQGECTHTCGGGRQMSTRTCTNPAPMYGGKDCGSSDRRVTSCNTQHCPIDGAWSDYKPAGNCSVPCGGGLQIMTRACDQPEAQHGGKPCEGEEEMQVECNSDPCPIDGGWGDWYDSVPCTATCGSRAMRRQERKCDNPVPAFGGAPCVGSKYKNLRCDVQPCPVNGGWGTWSSETSCSVTCGGGILHQTRQCNNPSPAYGGSECEGEATKEEPCNNQPCHVQTTVAPVCGNDNQAGPHSIECLRKLWLNAGCATTGAHYPTEEKTGLLDWWNTQTVSALRQDFIAYRNKAGGNDEKYLNFCYGILEAVAPDCGPDNQAGNHTIQCLRQLWLNAGCATTGAHYPTEEKAGLWTYWKTKTVSALRQDFIAYRNKADGNDEKYLNLCYGTPEE